MIEVWSVQFEGEPFDLWETKEAALDAAAQSVIERMGEGEDQNLDFLANDASEQEIVDWWNNNREPKVEIKRHTVLSRR